jgi:hypothetical protein
MPSYQSTLTAWEKKIPEWPAYEHHLRQDLMNQHNYDKDVNLKNEIVLVLVKFY